MSLNGLVDENYKIIDYTGSKIPQLSFHFLSKKKSWENLAFAFYFQRIQINRFPVQKILILYIKIISTTTAVLKQCQSQVDKEDHGFALMTLQLFS